MFAISKHKVHLIYLGQLNGTWGIGFSSKRMAGAG